MICASEAVTTFNVLLISQFIFSLSSVHLNQAFTLDRTGYQDLKLQDLRFCVRSDKIVARTTLFFKEIFVSLGGSQNRNFTVCSLMF